MSDLFEPFRTPDPVVPPLPPTEVRRQGDRLRRRRHGLQGAAVACAVALVAGGAFLLGGDADPTRSEPPVATQDADPSPSAAEPVTRIPDGFPLAEGVSGELTGPGRDIRFVADLEICDASASPADLATDRLTVTSTDVGLSQGRDLSVYPNAGTATAAAQDLVGKYRACPRYTLDGGASYARNDVAEWDASSDGGNGTDRAWTVVKTYESGGEPQRGQQIVQLVLRGNALLVTAVYGEGPGATAPGQLARDVVADREVLTPVLDAMCAFAADRC